MSRCRLHTRVEIRNFLLTFIDVDEPIFFIRNSIKMSELFRQKCKEYVSSNRKMKIKGTKWEYPIPKSTEYWEKVCDEEAKKILVVRDPFLHISYRSIPEHDTKFCSFDTYSNNKAFNLIPSSNSDADGSKVSENSLRKLPSPKSRLNPNKGHYNGRELFPKSILKASSRAVSKSSGPSCNLDAPSKVTRIPKLDTPSPRPSSSRIFPGKVDHIRASFVVRNEPKARDESLPTYSTTPSTLNAFPTISASHPTLKKSRKHLPKHPEHKYPRLARGKDNPETISHASVKKPVGMIDKGEKKFRKPLKAQDPSNFSTRCAYKALKYLTRNKKLDFDRRDTFFESSDDPSDHGDESLGLCKSKEPGRHKQEDEESSQVELKRKSLKDSQFIDTDVERATLKSEKTMSKTIPSGTRCTSGPSPQFIHPETRETPSASILSSIPKLSGYPRKNRDRCLPCMYKSFQTPSPPKISFPMTVLRRTINPETARSSSPSSTSLESTSISIPSFEDEIQRILNSEVKTRIVMFDEEHANSQSGIVKETPSSFQEKVEGPVETAEQKGIPDSETSVNKVTTRNDEEDQGGSDLTSVTKDLNAIAKCTQVASLERSKVSFSVHSVSSVEDESFSVSIGDDQSKRKHVAPCHAPTIFRPSLEPLRALRLRKPTTLQDRIALTKSTLITKSTSVDDYDDVPNKTNKSKIDTKKLKLENTELRTPSKEQHVLRKVTSLLNLTVSKDTVPESSEIVAASLTNALQNLASVHDNGSSRTTNSSKPVSTVPLRRTDEIVDTLTNVKENASSTCMLESLCKEFSERLSKNVTNKDTNAKRTDETMTTLTRLLVDSKRYLYPDEFPSDLLFSTNQPPPCNPRILRHVLPPKSYNLIAPLLGLPEWQPKKEASFADIFGRRRRIDEIGALEETVSTFDNRLASLEVHPPTPRDTESVGDEEEVGQHRYNPYALFLIRPRRKVVTWRPLKENDMEGYDPDATLRMRADNVMKKICQDFCQWLETLGGTDTTVDEEVLRDMFEIDFNAEACRAMQVSIQEMPVVPAEVALTRNNPGASMLAMTRNHLMKDVKAEETSAKTKAFGTAIPWELQFVPPKNQVRKLWLECENVPRDLETMDVVWKGITHLKSVRGFAEWLQQHPEVPPPEALKTLVSMDLKTLRQTEDDEGFAHLELDVNQITSLKVADSVQVVS